MAVNLTKGQKISLSKTDGSALKQVFLGCGWDVAKKEGGFLGKFFGGSDQIDLDASVILFDQNQKFVDAIYFGQLTSLDGSVKHSGDNLTGAGEGDDEVIYVNLDQVLSRVQSLVFTISSFRGQTFQNVANAFVRLVDQSTHQEVARYNISAQGHYTSLIVAKIYRHNGEWKMHAIGEPCEGRTFKEMLPSIIPVL